MTSALTSANTVNIRTIRLEMAMTTPVSRVVSLWGGHVTFLSSLPSSVQ